MSEWSTYILVVAAFGMLVLYTNPAVGELKKKVKELEDRILALEEGKR